MPTYTCLCCGHTQAFDTPEEAFEASWDVAPYFTLQRCVISVRLRQS